ncbi:MAG: hypothetical protein U0821_13665 [Chloroflexota bacterium]
MAARTEPIIPDNPNWNRFRGSCPHYREKWYRGEQPDGFGGRLLYQSICLMNTPPETYDEQEKCMATKGKCWRVADAERAARAQRRREEAVAG